MGAIVDQNHRGFVASEGHVRVRLIIKSLSNVSRRGYKFGAYSKRLPLSVRSDIAFNQNHRHLMFLVAHSMRNGQLRLAYSADTANDGPDEPL